MCEFELPLWGRQVQQSVAWTVLEVAAGSVLLGQEHTVLSDRDHLAFSVYMVLAKHHQAASGFPECLVLHCLESHPAGGAYDGRPDGGPIL